MLPRFKTERLLLRPRRMQDLEACLAMDRDPDVVAFIDGPWADPAAHRAFVVERITSDYPEGMGYWTVVPRDAGHRFLGWILLLPLNLHGPDVEIGWRFTRRNWGRGYASEAATPVLRHALETLALPSVVAEIHPDNVRSIQVAKKIGLRFMGASKYQGQRTVRYGATGDDFSFG